MTLEHEQDTEIDWGWPAERINSLDELEDAADCVYYEAAPDGTFKLSDAAKKRIGETRKRLAEVRADGAATVAKAEAEVEAARESLAATRSQLRDLVAGKAIRDYARRAGCKVNYLTAVEAVLLRDLDIVVEEIDGDLVAVLADGGSLEMAVGGYLAAEGDAFIETVPTVGAFASAIRSLH